MYRFSIKIHYPLPVFRDNILLKKKISQGQILIEQIIEFELRSPGRTCTPTTGYFPKKTKISKEYLRVDYFIIYSYNIAESEVLYFHLPRQNHLQNLTPKCKFERF